MRYYQVSAQVYPVQFGGVKVHTFIFKHSAGSLPSAYFHSFGNFYTIRQYFVLVSQAQEFASQLHSKFAVSPSYPPNYLKWLVNNYKPYYVGSSSVSDGQLFLF